MKPPRLVDVATVESVEVVYERGFVILGWVDVMR